MLNFLSIALTTQKRLVNVIYLEKLNSPGAQRVNLPILRS
jgi:hypothetical protein